MNQVKKIAHVPSLVCREIDEQTSYVDDGVSDIISGIEVGLQVMCTLTICGYNDSFVTAVEVVGFQVFPVYLHTHSGVLLSFLCVGIYDKSLQSCQGLWS